MLQGRERIAFLRGLIGAPYEKGAEGPVAWDCYGLVRHVSRHLFDHHMPSREVTVATALHRWRRVPIAAPVDGALILMHLAAERHVGIYLQEGGVLHAMEPLGWSMGHRAPAVALDKLFTLRFYGFSRIRMYVANDTAAEAREPDHAATA